jgi:hypothetical protein
MPEGVAEFETYLGKVGLEDAVAIHDIEYTVLEGVYWPAGCDVATKYGAVVKALYSRRSHEEFNSAGVCVLKVKKTAEGESIKRILNAGAFGTFIQKQSETENKFTTNKALNSFIFNEWHRVSRYQKYGRLWMVELFHNDPSVMPVMWGICVLEASKRAMNQVLNCLSALGLKAFYTDTDSLTVEHSSVPLLAAEYKERYGSELLGNDLGQMNSDFSLCDDLGKPIADDHVVSEGFACAGKKSYLHLLRGETPDGKVHRGYKASAKGITKAGLIEHARSMCPVQLQTADEETQIREGMRVLYTKIATRDDPGERIDLFPPRSKKRKFTYTSDSVTTQMGEIFTRLMKNTRRD